MCCDDPCELPFCENETNNERLFGVPNVAGYVRDAIDDYVVRGATDAVNPALRGTKVAAPHGVELEPGASARLRMRLTSAAARSRARSSAKPLGAGFDRVLGTRRDEADEFYATGDRLLARRGRRQRLQDIRALDQLIRADLLGRHASSAGRLLWSKQCFEYAVHTWLREHGVNRGRCMPRTLACATQRRKPPAIESKPRRS